jgi:hypothetical protein
MTSTRQPTTVRQLDTPAAMALADLTSMLDDLQTVLYCCERLVAVLGADEPDGVLVESLWTTALLSYSRCFTNAERGMALTEEDVGGTSLQGEVVEWHKVLRQLRKHYSSPAENPRERFSVGVAQDDSGTVDGIAITSARQPRLDEITVRQTGALAYELSRVVETRMAEQQERVLAAAKALDKADLEKLPLIDLTVDGPAPEAASS